MKTFKGKPVTLAGEQLKVGDIAPNFTVTNNQLEDLSLNDFKNDYVIISVIPSIDTPVCDLQTKTVNNELIGINNLDLAILTISMDLPFAQRRWLNAEELEGNIILSDYNYRDFGLKYGVLMTENNLLARTIFVLNKKREIIYKLEVDEMNQHLDYDLLVNFLNDLPGK